MTVPTKKFRIGHLARYIGNKSARACINNDEAEKLRCEGMIRAASYLLVDNYANNWFAEEVIKYRIEAFIKECGSNARECFPDCME